MTDLPSYVCGSTDKPLRYQTIGDVLADAARRWPHRDAILSRHQNIRLTYRELDLQVNRLAHGLLNLGLTPGGQTRHLVAQPARVAPRAVRNRARGHRPR